MVAEFLLAMKVDFAADLAEARSQHRAEAVNGGLQIAGRFDLDQLLDSVEDIRLLLAEVCELFRGPR
jgi:hypothetical protein